ncbi:homing endonuclease [Bacillus phage Eldridge]|uniref:Homing endonuclease n=1 Tax=Bacillus phage Eldridge TaxID=1776293 RepID=A0A0Y0AEN2_9CAUD|nr:homing endonuclease [Bacillus phage Eldridge]AMB18648.1 hypothetical protein Eldridge_068 [Bacillus phage Eldridge]
MPRRLTYEEVRDAIAKEGYTLVSEEYINATTKLDIRCPHDHTFPMRWNDFKTGFRCKYCSGKAQYTLKQVKEIVESRGYTLLDTDYENSHSYLNMLCPEGHPCKIKFHAFNNRGDGCGICGNDKRAKSNTYTYEEVKELIYTAGYVLLSQDYRGSNNKIDIQCNKNHAFPMTLKMFNQGQRCPICKNSKGEALVYSILEELIGRDSFNTQHKVMVGGRRLYFDFCIDNLFIEYDGIQHFEPIEQFGGLEGFRKTKIRDRMKNNYVEKRDNTDLLRLPYYLTNEEVRDHIIQFLSKHRII